MEKARRCIVSGVMLLVFSVFGHFQTGGLATAAEWPTKDITVIVHTTPGGSYDIAARTTGPFVQKYLPKKANVVVKNIPGAAGKIGLMETLRSKPDGYTVGLADPLDVSVLQVSKQIPGVDFLKISWLARLDDLPLVFVLTTKGGLKTIADLKNKPIRFVSQSSSMFLVQTVVGKLLGCDPQMISYEGTSTANLALLQGDVDAIMINWPSAMRMVNGSEGKLTALFICEGVSEVKNVPTAKDVGIHFEKILSPLLRYSHALYGPAGLPAEVKGIWEETMNKVFADPEWIALMNKAGISPSGRLTGGRLREVITNTLESAEKYKGILESGSIVK